MKFASILTLIIIASAGMQASAEKVVPIKYGDMDSWVTRNVKESGLIGGKIKKVYAVGPTKNIDGDAPYHNMGGSPWASSNVVAKVARVTKTSNAVYPEPRNGGHCAKLCSQIEQCKALGVINVDVMVAGSLFLGEMLEPITSTKNPYAKMEMGVPFEEHPSALVFDYMIQSPASSEKVYSPGFGKKRRMAGRDNPEVIVILQRRWEDADGKIYAKRVGTAHELFRSGSCPWHNGHHLHITYGEPAKTAHNVKGLIPAKNSYYARNSKGKMVPVTEVGWDEPDATPTHLIVMFSAGSGEPYVGTPGLTLYVDNVALAYEN